MESREAESASRQDEDDEHKDFFVSYTGADQRWAEWIAWCLEQVGYSVIIQAWDFPAGSNFVYEMDQALKVARRMIVVLSPEYLRSQYAFAEWAAMFHRDPQGRQRWLVPVLVHVCDVEGLLGPIVHIDLVGLPEPEARHKLLASVRQERTHPTTVDYPGGPALTAERPVFPGALPETWMVPFSPNPFFTGRDDDLKRLAEALRREQRAALTQSAALSGLGGVGKTQLAVEYAYRYRQDYERVFWMQADSQVALISGFVQIAQELELPQRDEKDQAIIVQAVQRWLQTHDRWLLILDNADDPGQIKEFLPIAVPSGHILLTTRAQALSGLAQRIEVEVLDEEQGALLLLRRADRIKPDETLAQAGTSNIAEAKALARDLGRLPLALDQVGAYIEETSCSLTDYHALYQKQRKALLALRGGKKPDHPESVTVTFQLAFEKVERKNQAAADLLRLCAFLASDAIPEEIITQGAEHLGPKLMPVAQDPLLLDAAIVELRAYSLVQRDATGKAFSVHRLVQAVLKDEMDQRTYREWAECTVHAVNDAFPLVEFANWSQCERLLPHALSCAELVEQEKLTLYEAGRLLARAGCYLRERARYDQAEPLFLQALEIDQQVYGPQDLQMATDLNHLAFLYWDQGRYREAGPQWERVLEIRQQQLDLHHPELAEILNNLACHYQTLGNYGQAESLLLQALEIDQQIHGPEHKEIAIDMANLADLYRVQGRYEEARDLLEHALAMHYSLSGGEDLRTAQLRHKQALLYGAWGKHELAQDIWQQVKQTYENQLGREHPNTAQSMGGLAECYRLQGKYHEAEDLLHTALAIKEQRLGAQHPSTAMSLFVLASLSRDRGKNEQAEAFYQRALAICKQVAPDHPDTALGLNNLALLYYDQEKYQQAEPLYKQALAICERVLGGQHPRTVSIGENYVALLWKMGRSEEAWKMLEWLQQAPKPPSDNEEEDG